MQTTGLGLAAPELKKYKKPARHKVFDESPAVATPKAAKKKLVLKLKVKSPLMKKALKPFITLTPKA